MGSINQYLDLYKENRDAINTHSADVLNGFREVAFKAIGDCQLPKQGAESYEKNINR